MFSATGFAGGRSSGRGLPTRSLIEYRARGHATEAKVDAPPCADDHSMGLCRNFSTSVSVAVSKWPDFLQTSRTSHHVASDNISRLCASKRFLCLREDVVVKDDEGVGHDRAGVAQGLAGT